MDYKFLRNNNDLTILLIYHLAVIDLKCIVSFNIYARNLLLLPHDFLKGNLFVIRTLSSRKGSRQHMMKTLMYERALPVTSHRGCRKGPGSC